MFVLMIVKQLVLNTSSRELATLLPGLCLT